MNASSYSLESLNVFKSVKRKIFTIWTCWEVWYWIVFSARLYFGAKIALSSNFLLGFRFNCALLCVCVCGGGVCVCSVLTDVNQCHISWAKNKSCQTDLKTRPSSLICYHPLVSGVITECRRGYQQLTITWGHEEGREWGGGGGEGGGKGCWGAWSAETEGVAQKQPVCVFGDRDQNPERRVAARWQIWDRHRQGFN